MKTFLIIEDDMNAPGGVSISVMNQQTVKEAQLNIGMYFSVAGQCAIAARDAAETMRQNSELIRQKIAEGTHQCLH